MSKASPDSSPRSTVKVHFDDCRYLVDGTVVDVANWSERARRRVAIDPERRGVVLVDGRECVVVPVIEATRIYWKAI